MRSVVRVYLGPPLKNEATDSGDIAQLGERRLCKPEVTGSIPVISTSEIRHFFRPRGRVKIKNSLFDNSIGDRKASIFEPI
jgi:hypothetical protein